LSASPKGRLIVISGPSGVGKSSIVDAVLARTDARFSVSATTRAARPDEVEGTDYAFSMTREEFGALREAGEILEWAEYGGNLYGTLRRAVLPLVEAGHDVILDIENEGAKQIRAAFGDALMIFIAPPGLENLAKRLTARGDTSAEDMARRLGVAEDQMAEAYEVFDHIVVNDDLVDAIASVLDILKEPHAQS
jgi:guanylate kinase